MDKPAEEVKQDDLLTRITEACRGLTYISESDAAVEPFAGGKADSVTAETVRKAAGIDPNAKPHETKPDEFFARLTRVEPWFDKKQKKAAVQFAELEDLLRKDLSDLKVFRFGRIRIAIVVAGLSKEGELLGIRTQAVET